MNMTENGYGPAPGHMGRIPNYGKPQVNATANPEPPACIQNAMMTKDKKPFTYTPGGLDLSQIRKPSMARRMARQRSQEEHEQMYAQQANNGGFRPQGGPVPPPPPPPPAVPAPPPPPPLVIQAPNAKAPKPAMLGERPEIVIPENPIGMLRKTNSPYHWESEQEQMQRLGQVPKFVQKVPSPLTVKLPSQQAPSYNSPQAQNNVQRQNNPYQNNQTPESPLHRPEAQYAHQMSNSPGANGSPQTRELLVRQDSLFNKSPQPFGNQSPVPNSSPYSPSPGPNWRQPEKRDSPASTVNNSPQSPHLNRGPFSPNHPQSPPGYMQSSNPVFHTLPRTGQRNQESFANNSPNNYNNVKEITQQRPNAEPSNVTPWRTNTLNKNSRGVQYTPSSYNSIQNDTQQAYNPSWNSNDTNNNRTEINNNTPWKQESKEPNQQQSYTPPWVAAHDPNNNRIENSTTAPWRSQEPNQKSPQMPQEQPRYQSSISIPVSPRKQNQQPEYINSPQQKEAVYVNQEPVYYCPESPKSIPPWVKTQKEKTKTPPPVWCQRPLEGRRSSRDLATPPGEANAEPEWVRKSNDLQRGGREVVSPPKHQPAAQPNWSTRPSDNRKSLPRDTNTQGSRIIPIQMEVSSNESMSHQGRQGGQQPQLRIVIDMKQNPEGQNQGRAQAPFTQPTQRIMRVLSPQLVRFDEGSTTQQQDLPSLNRTFQNNQESQPKTRIIPIQIEGASNGGANKSVYYHHFIQEASPKQSKAFRVLQIITGTEGNDDYKLIEDHHGYSDL